MLELKESHTVDKQTEIAIQYFLNRFFMCRISMKMLINQVQNRSNTKKIIKFITLAQTPVWS